MKREMMPDPRDRSCHRYATSARLRGPGTTTHDGGVRAHFGEEDPTDDTSAWASELQFAHWRTLDSVAKLRIVSEQSIALHRLSLAGLAARYPDDSPEELELKAHALRIGRDVLERCIGRTLTW